MRSSRRRSAPTRPPRHERRLRLPWRRSRRSSCWTTASTSSTPRRRSPSTLPCSAEPRCLQPAVRRCGWPTRTSSTSHRCRPGEAAMASELFLDRARGVRADLVADDAVLDEVGAMTELLDGVPLAIELAAARVSTFSIGEIVHLLRQDAAGLGDGRHRGPSRHRSLRAAILWSVGLLHDTERAVLCRLSVLPGSFRLGTATAVAGTGDGAERVVADAVHTLTEQSLVSTEHRAGPTRYRLLEMVRAVGQEGLTAGERHEVLDRLVHHCLGELAQLEGQGPPGGRDRRRDRPRQRLVHNRRGACVGHGADRARPPSRARSVPRLAGRRSALDPRPVDERPRRPDDSAEPRAQHGAAPPSDHRERVPRGRRASSAAARRGGG